MSYQWDARKARRAHLVKLGCVFIATVACVGIPGYILVEAIRL